MNILHNSWTVLTAISTAGSAYALLFTLVKYIKKVWGKSKMEAKSQYPYKQVLIFSFGCIILSIIGFYIFGGFDKPIPNDTDKKPQSIQTNGATASSKAKSDTPESKQHPIKHIKHTYVKVKSDTSSNSIKTDNSVTVKGNDNHIVGGTSNTVGINGDQYNGVKQRSLNKVYKKIIFDVIPDNKKDTIIIRFNADKESRLFKDEIVNYLRANGYEHVIPIVSLGLYGDEDLIVKPFAGKYFIFVYPSSNVNQ